SLWQKNLLPPGFSVIGNARTDMTDDAFRGVMRDAIKEFASEQQQLNESAWQSFAQGLFYVPGAGKDHGMFKRQESMLAKIEAERHTGDNRVYYLSTPPSLYDPIIDQVAKFKLNRPERGWARIVVEKPFGRDLESARALNKKLTNLFEEDAIFR